MLVDCSLQVFNFLLGTIAVSGQGSEEPPRVSAIAMFLAKKQVLDAGNSSWRPRKKMGRTHSQGCLLSSKHVQLELCVFKQPQGPRRDESCL
jgi:hypothetical protein